MAEKKTHFIHLRVIDEPGVLVRVAQVFTRRSFNIDSLEVNEVTDEPNQADIIIKARGNADLIHQTKAQLQKLINVLTVSDESK
ncbi:acetolactate synthase small subunit [Candidatus Saccharibacteria bacterium]|jgi:acetolactate synthase-1/3 small subunit|nr:acetolactate synthase small subunit [Candidatus Saccharibacteria bacterium]